MPAHPFSPEWLPAVTFDGADVGVVWNDISPRLGLTYDLFGTAKTVAKASYAIYYRQMLMPNLAVGASYIWRKHDRFAWNDRIGFGSGNYVARTFTPVCTAPSARCEPVTYYEPTRFLPAPYRYTNQPDRYRSYNGVELTLTKRYSDRWQASFSFAYNDAVDHWDSPDAYEDPTPRTTGGSPSMALFVPSQQYAPEAGASAIDNVFVNAKWLMKASGLYTLPW